MFKNLKIMLATLVLSLGLAVQQAQAVPVDLELSLLVDVSGSINDTEFNLQRTGYVNAFNNASIVNAIEQGTIGSIAVNFIYWSSGNQQQQAVGWTLINNTASANAFATAIANAARPFNGNTGPGSAINFGAPLFANNGFEGTRLVMDVSGDGEQNSGADTSDARDAAAALGITINGLVIGNASLLTWYQQNVITADGFALQAVDFASFGAAIDQKLVREIGEPEEPNAVPEPSTMLLLSSGVVGLYRLRKKNS